MTINNTTALQQALFYRTLASESSLLSNYYNNYGTQNTYSTQDTSPYLNCLYGSSYSSSFSSMMNVFMMFMMKIISQLFSQNLSYALNNANETSTGVLNETTSTNQTGEIRNLTSDNIDSDLRNQKGTSYVIACGNSCSRCKKFSPIVDEINKTLGSEATFYKMNADDETKLYTTLKNEAGNTEKSCGYPIVIKCVDGKATEFYSYSDLGNIYTDTEKMTKWFSSKL